MTPPPPTTATTGRSLPLLLTAAGLVVAVTIAVLVFGVSRPPALEPLADHPDEAPRDALAWVGWDDDRQCLNVAWPDGTTTRPYCDQRSSELLGWVDENTVLLANWEPGTRAIEVDTRDGTIRDNRPRPAPRERIEPQPLTVTRDHDELIVLGADGTELWRVDAPTTYRIDGSTISPDGDHGAFVDNAGRLLVVATDGSTLPRVWARDVGGHPEAVWSSERLDDNVR